MMEMGWRHHPGRGGEEEGEEGRWVWGAAAAITEPFLIHSCQYGRGARRAPPDGWVRKSSLAAADRHRGRRPPRARQVLTRQKA